VLQVYHARRERVEATADANLAVAVAISQAATHRAAADAAAAQDAATADAAARAATASAATARAAEAATAEAAETRVPFDRRVRSALVAQLRERAPYLLAVRIRRRREGRSLDPDCSS